MILNGVIDFIFVKKNRQQITMGIENKLSQIIIKKVIIKKHWVKLVYDL